MNFPEVWNFEQKQKKSKHESYLTSQTVADKISAKLPIARMVSVLMPQANISDFLAIIDDSSYYLCEDLKLSDILNKNFIEGFLNHGSFHCRPVVFPSSDCNSFFVCNNKIYLRLKRESLFSLRAVELTSHKSLHRSSDNSLEYKIDLLDKKLNVTKLNEELKDIFVGVSFNIMWIPTSKNICCSSIAKYFSDSNHVVKLCGNKFIEKNEYGLKFPRIPSDDDFADISEYIGMILLGCKIELNDFNSYELPYDCEEVGQGIVIHCTGFITQSSIQRLINTSLKTLEENPSFPWIAMSIIFNSTSEISSRLLIISREKIHLL